MSESDLIVVRRLEDPGHYDNVRVGDPIFEQVQRWLDNARRSARSQQLGQPPKIYSEDEVTSFKWAEEICLNICAGDAIRLIDWMEAVPPCRVEARAKDEVHGLWPAIMRSGEVEDGLVERKWIEAHDADRLGAMCLRSRA